MKRLASVLLVGLLMASLPAVADDPLDELAEVRKEISDLKSQIDRSKSETRKIAEDLEAAEEQMNLATAAVEEAQGKVDSKQVEIEGAEAHLIELQGQLKAMEDDLALTRSRLGAARRDLEEQILDMYMSVSAMPVDLILGTRSAGEFSLTMAYRNQITQDRGEVVAQVEALRAEEQRQADRVKARSDEVLGEIADLEVEKAGLEEELAKLDHLRATAEAAFGKVQKMVNDIKDEIRHFEEDVRGLEADVQRIRAEIAAAERKGGEAPSILARPVPGVITSPFGYRIHPIYGTRRLHAGIDFDGNTGDPIKAAGAGVVIMSQWYGGYGNAVVIDHGGGLTTLYAHQSGLSVRVGQDVAIGQVIGRIGSTGNSTGPHLHFETRENGTPVNPMKYLGG